MALLCRQDCRNGCFMSSDRSAPKVVHKVLRKVPPASWGTFKVLYKVTPGSFFVGTHFLGHF